MKVAMLSQYTDDLTLLYEPDREAVFFHDQRELLDKLARLLHDEAWRQSVAVAGYSRVYEDCNDVYSRMSLFLSIFKVKKYE